MYRMPSIWKVLYLEFCVYAFMIGTYSLIYQYHLAHYKQIHYMGNNYIGLHLPHITRETCILMKEKIALVVRGKVIFNFRIGRESEQMQKSLSLQLSLAIGALREHSSIKRSWMRKKKTSTIPCRE